MLLLVYVEVNLVLYMLYQVYDDNVGSQDS